MKKTDEIYKQLKEELYKEFETKDKKRIKAFDGKIKKLEAEKRRLVKQIIWRSNRIDDYNRFLEEKDKRIEELKKEIEKNDKSN